MSDDTHPIAASRRQNKLLALWPYLAFLLFVTLFSLLFLADGFNATDEGYLQSLAQRIVDGQRPGVDFYFLRPPLSLYIQAGLLALFGDSYSILAARWFWTLQMVLLTLMLSVVYRSFVNRTELFLLLCVSWIVSSLLIAFPWYSYDAAFFAVVALVLLHRRRHFAAGIAMLLAGLAKQNYLLLPCFLIVAALVQWRWRKTRILTISSVVGLVAGFAVATLAYLGYLAWYGGGIEPFIENVFVLPHSTSDVPTSFLLFQNNHEALLKALPTIAAVVLLFWFSHRSRIILVVAVLVSLAAVVASMIDQRWFIYQVVYLNYTLLIVASIRLVAICKRSDKQPLTPFLTLAVAALVIQYLSGFNYSGVLFGYMGAAPGLVIGWVVWRKLSPSPHRRTIATAVLLVVVTLGLFYKYDFVYRDDKRHRLDSQFTESKLAGVLSTRRNVNQVASLVATVNEYTNRGDYIFVFPDMPALYYLTDRKNPTPIDWYALREFNLRMLTESITALEQHRPKLILLQSYAELDFRRAGDPYPYLRINRWAPFIKWLIANYKKLDMVGDVVIFVPVDSGRIQRGE
ncbi:MAG: hypothetical protein KAW46_02045 [candidate division Zixibacteria bacterium]|nr:hypothetical protein [candidate division Zixibacteria bacterium]